MQSTLQYTIPEAWANACIEEGIPVDSKFVVFSRDNVWARRYARAMDMYFRSLGEVGTY